MVALLDLFVAVFSGYLYDKTRGREQLDVAKDDAAAIGDKKTRLPSTKVEPAPKFELHAESQVSFQGFHN